MALFTHSFHLNNSSMTICGSVDFKDDIAWYILVSVSVYRSFYFYGSEAMLLFFSVSVLLYLFSYKINERWGVIKGSIGANSALVVFRSADRVKQ